MSLASRRPARSSRPTPHREHHRSDRTGWLRAAVLGANDGIVSTASLLIGVAAGGGAQGGLLLTGVAALVAGAMSMAAGEYVSVSSQADTEQADLARERHELAADPAHEHDELAAIYVDRGLSAELAEQVAFQLMSHDALGAHARDELGLTATAAARPVQAALTSALTFATGAALPLAVTLLLPPLPGGRLVPWLAGWSLVFLVALGGLAARAGGAPVAPACARVAGWGALAMAITAGVGRVLGSVG